MQPSKNENEISREFDKAMILGPKGVEKEAFLSSRDYSKDFLFGQNNDLFGLDDNTAPIAPAIKEEHMRKVIPKEIAQ